MDFDRSVELPSNSNRAPLAVQCLNREAPLHPAAALPGISQLNPICRFRGIAIGSDPLRFAPGPDIYHPDIYDPDIYDPDVYDDEVKCLSVGGWADAAPLFLAGSVAASGGGRRPI